MNIVHIIGNGFDLNIGLETSYSDFFRYYKSIESSNSSIINLKKDIDEQYENWADLELQLGKYSENLANLHDLDIILDDMRNNLAEYLMKKETEFDYSKVDREKLLIDIYSPEAKLDVEDRKQIQEFKKKSTNPWVIDILTFNYTRSIEKIIGEKYEGIQLTTHRGKPVVLDKLEHIHGSLDDNMVLGVNDISQLANVDFRENVDVLETLVKPEQNRAIKDGKVARCHQVIRKANLISIYGSSLGKTDQLWWELIGQRLLEGCFVIIFIYSKLSVPPLTSYIKGREVRKTIEKFLLLTQLSDSKKEKVKNRIFVGINTTLFNMK